MIVCSCNVISDREIAEIVVRLKKQDPLAVITPGVVFKKLGKRPNCGNCLPLFSRTMLLPDPDPNGGPARIPGPPLGGNGKAPPEQG